MKQNGYYTHVDRHRYGCEVLEDAGTQVRVRLSEETAREWQLSQELWLPVQFIRIERA